MKNILVVEDDRTMSRMLLDILEGEGYAAVCAYEAGQAMALLGRERFDLAILDVNLPDGSGYDICRHLRDAASTAVIFLTANDLERDVVRGYELGCADYITKPFSTEVLRHKIRAILALLDGARPASGHDIYDDGRLRLDFSALCAELDGQALSFAPLEYRMLGVFVKNRGVLLTRQRLLELLWDASGNFVDEHTLTAAVSRLRGKLERAGGMKYIRTVYGMGYMFVGGDR